VRGKDGVDQGRFAQASLANTDDIKLKATFQQLSLNLRGNAVETDMASREDRILRCSGSRSRSHDDGRGTLETED